MAFQYSYGSGSTGLETTEEGQPDIETFEMDGFVCASFATYVYFNYLPSVAGIDTSCLTLPDHTPSANSFYEAAKQCLADGYTTNIGFDAYDGAEGIIFEPYEDSPWRSLLHPSACMKVSMHRMQASLQVNKKVSTHIIYLGRKRIDLLAPFVLFAKSLYNNFNGIQD